MWVKTLTLANIEVYKEQIELRWRLEFGNSALRGHEAGVFGQGKVLAKICIGQRIPTLNGSTILLPGGGLSIRNHFLTLLSGVYRRHCNLFRLLGWCCH